MEEEDVQENQYEFPGYDPDDSYIDEENFGYGYDEKMNRTVLRGPEDEAPVQPAEAPPVQPVGAPQGQPAPFEPEKPDFYGRLFKPGRIPASASLLQSDVPDPEDF